MEDLISVIVPIYNIENHISKCIKSILTQTYSSIEIILVDDGSIDSSGDICDQYAKADSRIIVIHKSNEGLVRARKDGLLASKGEYIVYVDGDDYIECDWIENLYQNMINTNADVVAAGHFVDVNSTVYPVHLSLSEGIYEIDAIAQRIISDKDTYETAISPFLWSKLWKRSILYNYQMEVDDRIRIAEDAAVSYPAILFCKSISIVDFCGYHYVQHSTSMMNSYSGNEAFEIKVVVYYLRSIANRFPKTFLFEEQVDRFERLLNLTRNICIYDGDKMILGAYGGIESKSKVIIYGAGNLGRSIYSYLSNKKEIEILGIVDKNFDRFADSYLNVKSTECLIEYADKADYVIVAVMNKNAVKSIKEMLRSQGYFDNQIKVLEQ